MADQKKKQPESLKKTTVRERKASIPHSEILMLLHENSEKEFHHTTYEEDNRRYHLLMQGDYAAVEESARIMQSDLQGKLSSDPVRNFRYLFIVNTGLATRFAIEAGVPQEVVYSTSDVYIQKADVATTEKEIYDLNIEFWTKLVSLVRESRRVLSCSKPVRTCLDYIDAHFTSRITLKDLAVQVKLHPVHLAVLFKKEIGENFSAYLTRKRIETSCALLTRTEYSFSQIAYSLAFCSQSHFIKVFRKHTGFTPRQYRMQFYNTNISAIT
jgi:YesN/AraC family two-component response regulator